MFNKILVPLDFTRKNTAALRTACRLLSGTRGQLTLIHVIERIEHLAPSELKDFYNQLTERADREMQRAVERLQDCPATVKRKILFGRRAEEIVEYARRNKMDLIVMSSNPLSANDAPRAWATVSHVVAVQAPCSTLLVK